MVLAELGSKISKALHSMSTSTVLDDAVIDNLIKQLQLALLQSDVDVKLVRGMTNNIKSAIDKDTTSGTNKRKFIQSTVIKELYGLLDSGNKPFQPQKGKQNVIMFVGLQGSGKTTSCTKYAYYYKRKGWKTCLVCADTFRAGAFDQLKQNATKAKIPFYGSYTERDPVVIAEIGVQQFKQEKYEIIIVDTSGRHSQEAALFEEMQELNKVINPDDIVFVMDSSIGQAARDQASAFKNAVDVGSVIITKLDGHAKGGGALSAVAATKSPILFVGTGEHIDDFQLFDTKSFVSRLLGMGDISGLLNLFQENKMFDKDSQPELYKKITEGTGDFTFRDMYEQFQQLNKLGSLGNVMQMIPGLSQMMGPGKEGEATARIQRFMTVMDSMSQQELDSDNAIFNKEPSRIVRIARGAGVPIRAVQEVMETFKPFKKVASKMKGMAKGGGMENMAKMMAGGAGGARGNPAANMNKLAGMFNPQMLQQMGGMSGMQNMMQQMMGGMGGGGMAEMMKSMGMGGGGARGGRGGGGRGGGGGMPNMAQMQQMMSQMGMGGGMPDTDVD